MSEHNLGACSTCHGKNGEGTVLSEVKVDRQFTIHECKNGSLCPDREQYNFTVNLTKGDLVDCGLCHENPYNKSHDRHDRHRWSMR